LKVYQVVFLDNYLTHTNSKLYCVDPFYISNTISGITTLNVDTNTEVLFHNNIKKVHILILTSYSFFEKINDIMFDIINYTDRFTVIHKGYQYGLKIIK